MTISFFILSLFNSFAIIYSTSKILNESINYKNKKFYIVLIATTLYTFFAYLITKSIIRVIITIQLYNFGSIYLFHNDKNDNQSITIATIFTFIICTLCEITVDLSAYFVLTKFFGATDVNYFMNAIGYLIVGILIILMSIKRFTHVITSIMNYLKNFKGSLVLFILVHFLFIFITSLYLIYFNLNQLFKFILLILTFLEFIYLVLIIMINIKNKEKIQKDLDLMLEITSKYENIINATRTNNHENKNQLIVIKDLIGHDNKKAISYINDMIKTKYTDDDKLMLKIANVPVGGLKGLIYYKLLTMKSKNIECDIIVEKGIDKQILNKINSKSVQDYYKIIGVFIDNAIEEANNIKYKTILIEIFNEGNYLFFTITNHFSNKANLEKIGKMRFTTKGEDHGYGLQLVKALVSENNDLIHESKINEDLFTQKIGIKTQKN